MRRKVWGKWIDEETGKEVEGEREVTMDEMTDDELRQEVARIRSLRDNHFEFKKMLAEEANEPKEKLPKKDVLEGWE